MKSGSAVILLNIWVKAIESITIGLRFLSVDLIIEHFERDATALLFVGLSWSDEEPSSCLHVFLDSRKMNRQESHSISVTRDGSFCERNRRRIVCDMSEISSRLLEDKILSPQRFRRENNQRTVVASASSSPQSFPVRCSFAQFAIWKLLRPFRGLSRSLMCPVLFPCSRGLSNLWVASFRD
jgi:hypothetical protein